MEGFPGVYFGPWRETADGRIPWATFWVLYRQLPALTATRRVHFTNAVAAGIGLVWNHDGAKPVLTADLEEAFPHG